MKPIKSALISVFNKDGIDDIVKLLHHYNVTIYSTGGTEAHITALDIPVKKVENLTLYPSILDGRVKTLHPKIFGGILAKRERDHLDQLEKYDIPEIDLVIVDLYPFEETVKNTDNESLIIEKIDIGGISLIRAAAKNYNDVVVISSQDCYAPFQKILSEQGAKTSKEQRKNFARNAFAVSSHYDTHIFNYFSKEEKNSEQFKTSISPAKSLRYGENPHQEGTFFGNLETLFDKIQGKELSYNNLVDVDAAVHLMKEFKDENPTFAVLKHTNPCGIATRDTILEAWKDALAGDPTSAFGGVLISNTEITKETALEINSLFYEILIAPSFCEEALEILQSKKKRILMKIKNYNFEEKQYKSLLNGVIQQDFDDKIEKISDFKIVTKKSPTERELEDLVFANKCAKHLKSNTIALVNNKQLVGMGCGQTSRVDACNQAIAKARQYDLELEGSVMASDAFFPFPDCVELADKAGITAIVQPGGSIKDQLSIDYCDDNELAMVFTGVRHFKH